MASYALQARGNFYSPRGGTIRGIVLHVTAGAEDTNMVGVDGSAEATVKYGQSQACPASWHHIVDSDSSVPCLPDGVAAWHVRGSSPAGKSYNRHTLGLEISNRDAKWAGKNPEWVQATLRNAAKKVAAWCKAYDLPVQVADKATVDKALSAGKAFGITYHSLLDPKRRTDPGKDFPKDIFLQMVRDEMLSVNGGAGEPTPVAPVVPEPPKVVPPSGSVVSGWVSDPDQVLAGATARAWSSALFGQSLYSSADGLTMGQLVLKTHQMVAQLSAAVEKLQAQVDRLQSGK